MASDKRTTFSIKERQKLLANFEKLSKISLTKVVAKLGVKRASFGKLLVFFFKLHSQLDFFSFAIAGPKPPTDVVGANFLGEDMATTGICAKDTFSVVNPGGTTPPVICGENGGEHMYVNFASECVDLIFDLGSGTDAEWSIRISQYDCSYENLAPSGCLQYLFGEDEGTIQSFNFKQDQHLADQRQKVCIRREINECEICYYYETKKDMRVSGAGDINDQCCGYGDDGSDANEGGDCLIIPSLFYFDQDGEKLFAEESEFCGADDNTFSDVYDEAKTVCSQRVPFQLTFLSDTYETTDEADPDADEPQRGFRIKYFMNGNC